MNAPDLTAPAAALEASKKARARVRALPPSDTERRAVLEASLGTLRDSWTAEHERYCRSGPQVGRLLSHDPVRVLGRERRAELARLRAALSRTSGTPRDERDPEHGGTQPPLNATQMRGHIRGFLGLLTAVERDHEPLRRVFGGGHPFAGMSELRREAGRLLVEVRRRRRMLDIAWRRYERRVVDRDPSKPYADADEWEHLADFLALARKRADEVTAVLSDSATRRQPIPFAERQGRWTAESARSALRGFQIAYGRKPRKRECGPAFNLPHYTQLRRLLGPRPLSGSSR